MNSAFRNGVVALMMLSLGVQGIVWAGFPLLPSLHNGGASNFEGGLRTEDRLAAAGAAKPKPKTSSNDMRAFMEMYRKRGADLDNFIYEVADAASKGASPGSANDTGLAKTVGLSDFRQVQMKWWLAAGAAGLLGTGIVGYFLLSSGSGKTKIVNIDYTDSPGPGN